jgi:hypothetical protein
MNRRVLVENIGTEKALAELGAVANLVFDRLLTITDDAGLAAGEFEVIKGRCFPFMAEMTVEKIGQAIAILISGDFLIPTSHNGRAVLAFKPSSFQNHQKLRKDYRRRFDFGKLSQVVWEQGLPGIVRDVHGFGAISSVTVTVTNSVTDEAASAAGDESAEAPTFPSGLTEFWDQYPKIGRQRSSRLKLLKPWTKWGCEKLLPEILGALEVYAESRSWQEGFVPGAHTWIANRKWTEAPAGNDDESLLRSM